MQRTDPRQAGFDPGRLASVRRLIEADVAANRSDGAVVIVARGGRVVLAEALGYAERATSRALHLDDVLVSMSVGKQFVNALVLSRVERGDLAVHVPIAEWLPEFRGRGKDRITLFHLLTHTSGIAAQVPALPPEELIDVARVTAYAAAAPLESVPGERVTYSIAVAHAVLGSLLVRVDGGRRSLTQMLREDLFEPLGMADTSLGPRADLVARLCPVVARYTEPGLFDPAALTGLFAVILMEGSEIAAGGFLTTAPDLHRFAEMLRRGGELDGQRILSPAMIALAARNHTGLRPNSIMDYTIAMRGWDPWPAYIGLGFFVRGEGVVPGPHGNLASPGAFGGWGAGSTAFWIDPARDLTFTFLSTGLMEDSRHIERVSRLSDLVLSALVEK
jgi:CubicO group peptidase (beta-lactamase class C family)